jgi:hypothetical protein
MEEPGFETSSYLFNLLQDEGIVSGSAEEVNVKWSAGSLYGGGADTVRITSPFSVVDTYILGKILNGDI